MNSKVVKISPAAYEKVFKLSQELGKSISEVASELILRGQAATSSEKFTFLEVATGLMGVCAALYALRDLAGNHGNS